MEEAALDAPVPGLDYTASNLLHGVIEHQDLSRKVRLRC